MSTPTQFAAAALGLLPPTRPTDRRGQPRIGAASRCWLCGGETAGHGWRQQDAIAPTFTQHNCSALPDSDAVCEPCVTFTRAEVFQALVTARGLPIKLWTQCGWHSYSHVVTADGTYEAPVPSRVRALLLEPPAPPFAIGLNPSGQKHSLFRTRVAVSRDVFPVHFDERTFLIDRASFVSLLADLEAMSALGIAKEQSETGRYHPESVRRAGLVAWRAGEARLARWRRNEPDLLGLAGWVGRGPKYFAENENGEAGT